jgi:hypothetical protein
MSRRWIPGLILIVLATAVAATASEADRIETLQGEIVAVDVGASAVAVQVVDRAGSEGKQVSLTIDGETTITKNGERLTLSQLRRGDRVVVNYRTESRSRARIALSIGVQA